MLAHPFPAILRHPARSLVPIGGQVHSGQELSQLK